LKFDPRPDRRERVTLTLSVEAARAKARGIIRQDPQHGYMIVVENGGNYQMAKLNLRCGDCGQETDAISVTTRADLSIWLRAGCLGCMGRVMDRASFEIEALDRRRAAETRRQADLSVQALREYELAVHLRLGPTNPRTQLARAARASGYVARTGPAGKALDVS
jgi:hypothetical protein